MKKSMEKRVSKLEWTKHWYIGALVITTYIGILLWAGAMCDREYAKDIKESCIEMVEKYATMTKEWKDDMIGQMNQLVDMISDWQEYIKWNRKELRYHKALLKRYELRIQVLEAKVALLEEKSK